MLLAVRTGTGQPVVSKRGLVLIFEYLEWLEVNR